MYVDDIHHFRAKIYLVGLNRCVDVPIECVRDDTGRPVPVVLTVGGRSKQTNLVSRGGGGFRVFVDSAMRKAARADVGDIVEVDLRLDLAEREPAIPSDLRAAMKGSRGRLESFKRLTLNQRREIVQYIESAKRQDTRALRVKRVLDVLEGRNTNTGRT